MNKKSWLVLLLLMLAMTWILPVSSVEARKIREAITEEPPPAPAPKEKGATPPKTAPKKASPKQAGSGPGADKECPYLAALLAKKEKHLKSISQRVQKTAEDIVKYQGLAQKADAAEKAAWSAKIRTSQKALKLLVHQRGVLREEIQRLRAQADKKGCNH